MNQEKIGKFISTLRKEKNMTQEQLAQKLNVTDKAVSKWENGRCMPDISLLQNITNELGITVNELLLGERISNNEYKEKTEENLFALLQNIKRLKNKQQKITFVLMIIFLIITDILFNLEIKYCVISFIITIILGIIFYKNCDN